MKTITLTVNGEERQASVEPRTSLADFLREELLLTGTHLGCEHGVCGACTVNIDGAPARSCITWAVTCDGSEISTIEDFDDDALMSELRQAFTAEHALQCGFCTPGMLITARDIVDRLGKVDDTRIRVELSGNLCRCTGYMGIVAAIRGVIDRQDEAGVASGIPPARLTQPKPQNAVSQAAPAPTPGSSGKMTVLEQTFIVGHPRSAVWKMFSDLPNVVNCMPGASLAGPPEDGHVAGRIAVKLGPIRADFAGEGEVELNGDEFSGVIRGQGLDSGHSSRARGEVTYGLTEAGDGTATRVDVTIAFSLSGPLAQFSRGGIVNAVADRLVERFAANLETALSGAGNARSQSSDPANELDMGSLIFSMAWSRIKAIVGNIFGRSR